MRWDHDRRWLRLSGVLPDDQGAVVAAAVERIAYQASPNPDNGLFEPFESRCADALTEVASPAWHLMGTPTGQRWGSTWTPSLCSLGKVVAQIQDGPAIAIETARRLACDARIEVAVDGPDGNPIGIGRASRKVPPWLNRQIRHRDQGCRFPGCERTRWAHSHHVEYWMADQGPDMDNLVTVCGTHHRLVHEQHWKIRGNPNGDIQFVRPDGRVYQPGRTTLRPQIRRTLLAPLLKGRAVFDTS
ncbi:MAG: DUF222 domain-containing protein [Acidimicrobiia bacterium]